MKILVVLLFSLVASIATSQKMSDFFSNKTQVVLLGLDFTQCKFIGKDGFSNPEGLKNHAIPNWNKFFATEPRKYSLQDALGLSDKYYYNSINYFTKRNEVVNTFRNVTDEDYTLTNDQIVENVSTYETFEKEGLAVSFVVESFNKLKAEAHIWVVYLSLPNNEIIYMEKMIGKPGGGGQVNFWARAIYDIVSQIEKKADELKNK